MGRKRSKSVVTKILRGCDDCADGGDCENPVFVSIRDDQGDARNDPLYEGTQVLGVFREDSFIGRGAPLRKEEHFRNMIEHRHCDCPFCDWFRANLILD